MTVVIEIITKVTTPINKVNKTFFIYKEETTI